MRANTEKYLLLTLRSCNFLNISIDKSLYIVRIYNCVLIVANHCKSVVLNYKAAHISFSVTSNAGKRVNARDVTNFCNY